MIKFNIDRSYLLPNCRQVYFIDPFWGKPKERLHPHEERRFEKYFQTAHQSLAPVSIKDADYLVYPCDIDIVERHREPLGRFAKMAREARKPAVAFFWNDSAEGLEEDGLFIFRTSLLASYRGKRDFAMPSWSEDFVTEYFEGRIPIRSKSGKPTVGFCGNPGLLSQRTRAIRRAARVLRRSLAWVGHKPSRAFFADERKCLGAFRDWDTSRARSGGLRALLRSSVVAKNFLLRDGFYGRGIPVAQARRDYVENMRSSDYVLCARGRGNFSYRLYETMSCGRIPLFINTNCVLPFETRIDWKKLVLWIDQLEVEEIAEKVLGFHTLLSNQEFENLQQKNRATWCDWIEPSSFFAKLHLEFLPDSGHGNSS